MEGLGQLANHTCCDIHWNANLEVAAIEHYEETEILPMGILRARKDIEKDTEILTRYWHTKKDAWHNIFECECCACTNHTGNTNNPPATADMTVIDDTVFNSRPQTQREAGLSKNAGPRTKLRPLCQKQAGVPRVGNGRLGLGRAGSFTL